MSDSNSFRMRLDFALNQNSSLCFSDFFYLFNLIFYVIYITLLNLCLFCFVNFCLHKINIGLFLTYQINLFLFYKGNKKNANTAISHHIKQRNRD